MVNTTPKWDRHSILAEFRRRGVRLQDFAEQHGRNFKGFSAVWTRYNRINEKLIADFLGDPVEVVWPDRYPAKKTRIFDGPTPAKTTTATTNSDTGRAA